MPKVLRREDLSDYTDAGNRRSRRHSCNRNLFKDHGLRGGFRDASVCRRAASRERPTFSILCLSPESTASLNCRRFPKDAELQSREIIGIGQRRLASFRGSGRDYQALAHALECRLSEIASGQQFDDLAIPLAGLGEVARTAMLLRHVERGAGFPIPARLLRTWIMALPPRIGRIGMSRSGAGTTGSSSPVIVDGPEAVSGPCRGLGSRIDSGSNRGGGSRSGWKWSCVIGGGTLPETSDLTGGSGGLADTVSPLTRIAEIAKTRHARSPSRVPSLVWPTAAARAGG